MTRVVLAAVSLAVTVPAAADAVTVSIDSWPREATTTVTVENGPESGCPQPDPSTWPAPWQPIWHYCPGPVTITRNGVELLRREITDVGPGWGETATYHWSCRRSGTHSWSVRVYDDSGSGWAEAASGTFSVPRCTPWGGMPVGRRSAERVALRAFRAELVSRLRCYPRGGAVRARWRCEVVHSTTYRVCRTVLRIGFDDRYDFGRHEIDVWRERLTRRCFYT